MIIPTMMLVNRLEVNFSIHLFALLPIAALRVSDRLETANKKSINPPIMDKRISVISCKMPNSVLPEY
jgi:hypothetical protein